MGQQSAARLFSRYFPLVAWLVFISYASSGSFSAENTSRIVGPLILWLFPNTSPETLAVVHATVRKVAHFTEYAILAYLAARAFRTSPHAGLAKRWFLASLILIIVYAAIDEYRQSFVPSRIGSIYDSLIDITGGLAALLFLRHRRRAAKRFNKSPTLIV